jgi:hypothetical protein
LLIKNNKKKTPQYAKENEKIQEKGGRKQLLLGK